MQRLEELMQWQRQQQEKLLRHQQEQKALITFEQKRLFQEIGAVLEQGKLFAGGCDSHDKSDQDLKNGRSHKDVTELDQKDISSPQVVHPRVLDSFDDTPVKHVTKSFDQLLQEKLKVDENRDIASTNVKPKRKFLKKGEGLARYRMVTDRKPKYSQQFTKKGNASFTNEGKRTGGTSFTQPKLDNKSVSTFKLDNQQGRLAPGALWSHSVQKMHSPAARHLHSPKKAPASRLDDSKHEQDELHLFELLEQQAANSSFCSTSSVVARFLGDSSSKVPSSSNFNKSPSKTAALENKVPLKTIKSPFSQPEVTTCAPKGSVDKYALLSNVNATGYLTSNSQLEHIHNGKSVGFCDSSSQSVLPKSINKKLLFNTAPAKEKLCPEDINDVSDSYGIKSKDDSSDFVDYIKKIPTCIDVAESQTRYKYGQYAKELADVETDTFRDSQAWSDCSCSSCGETDSDKESKISNSHHQQSITTENFVEDKSDMNKQVSIAAQGEAITFKSTLLKERLAELESEIEIFKKENANLKKLRKQHESDVVNFNREKKEYERVLKENTEKMQENLIAERKKLAREKLVFERYCKGIKCQPTRQEREEIQTLKQQVAELQEELIRKDTRWSATQVRTRDRMRQLNKQISQLKEENEKLKAEKAKIKKVRFLNPKGNITNTKVLHCINEKLTQLKVEDVENPIVIKNVIPRKRIPAHVLSESVTDAKEKNMEKRNKIVQIVPNLQSKLQKVAVNVDDLKYNTDFKGVSVCEDNCDNQECSNSDEDPVGVNVEEDLDVCQQILSNNTESPIIQTLMYNTFFPNHEALGAMQTVLQNTDMCAQISPKMDVQNGCTIPIVYTADKQGNTVSQEMVDMSRKKSNSVQVENNNMNNQPFNKSTISMEGLNTHLPREYILKEVSGGNPSETHNNEQLEQGNVLETVHSDGTREKKYSDGREEIWYPNGNLKKLSADKLITKMIYYNGDVKEKYYVDGVEKYYYAETKTWQTTYSDGREILEFPSGQVESKMSNGTTEISYPNGCTLLKHVDGSEEWSLTDGTVVKKSASGIKELLFPNGQKEVHAEDHKRREYPDGTVKFIYPNGTQETQYASGRVRRKDKDGNLIMDSASQ